jgi:hypothetical protein
MHSHPVRTLLVLVTLGLIGSVSGQRPEDGEVAFETKIRKSRTMREQLRKGDLSANVKDKEQVEAIEDTARMIVYPLYWRTLPNKPMVGKVNEVVDEFASKLSDYQRARPATNTFIQLLCKEVIDRSVEIIQHPRVKPIAGINAARILATIPQRRSPAGSPVAEKMWVDETTPRLADGNAKLLAETCLTLLADAKLTDGHRYYFYRCLASLLSLPQSPPLLEPETIDRILQKATEQIEKKVVFPKATPRQEVEGYKMLRQQAVLILAAGRKPIAGDKMRPVFTLARVAGADSDLAPAPRLSERVEAAIGLARMGSASAKLADIQMDYAAGAIVSAVIEFGKQANANREAKMVDRLQPWKVEAARLSEALDELKLAVKTPYVQAAVKECQGKVLGDLERNQLCDAGKLAEWDKVNSPPSKSLFKSDLTSTIKGAAAAPE